eukprot:scaffold14235_cov67-Isochrysis_galbana.AAC.1
MGTAAQCYAAGTPHAAAWLRYVHTCREPGGVKQETHGRVRKADPPIFVHRVHPKREGLTAPVGGPVSVGSTGRRRRGGCRRVVLCPRVGAEAVPAQTGGSGVQAERL